MGSERSSTGSSKANAETLPGRWSHEEIKTVEKLLGELIKAESDGISPQLSRTEVWLQCSTMLSESGFNRSAPALQRRFGPRLKICKEKSSYQLIPEDAVTTATANSEEGECTIATPGAPLLKKEDKSPSVMNTTSSPALPEDAEADCSALRRLRLRKRRLNYSILVDSDEDTDDLNEGDAHQTNFSPGRVTEGVSKTGISFLENTAEKNQQDHSGSSRKEDEMEEYSSNPLRGRSESFSSRGTLTNTDNIPQTKRPRLENNSNVPFVNSQPLKSTPNSFRTQVSAPTTGSGGLDRPQHQAINPHQWHRIVGAGIMKTQLSRSNSNSNPLDRDRSSMPSAILQASRGEGLMPRMNVHSRHSDVSDGLPNSMARSDTIVVSARSSTLPPDSIQTRVQPATAPGLANSSNDKRASATEGVIVPGHASTKRYSQARSNIIQARKVRIAGLHAEKNEAMAIVKDYGGKIEQSRNQLAAMEETKAKEEIYVQDLEEEISQEEEWLKLLQHEDHVIEARATTVVDAASMPKPT